MTVNKIQTKDKLNSNIIKRIVKIKRCMKHLERMG
jgi:hypothetical protein